MPPALRSSNHNTQQTSISLTGANAPLAHDVLLFTACYANAGTITGITGGGTWARIGTEQDDLANNQKVSFWLCADATGGDTTATPTTTGTFAAKTFVIAAFSGVTNTTPIRASDTTRAFATTSTSTDAETSSNITPTTGDLLVAALGDTGGTQASITAGTNWSISGVELGTPGSTGASALEYRLAPSGSAQGATYTVGTGSHSYTVQIVALIPASAVSADTVVINGTASQLVNVNAGGDDIDALSYKNGVTLTDTELATLLGTPGVLVGGTGMTEQESAIIKNIIRKRSA